MSEKVIKGLASVVGIETDHQQAMRAYAKTLAKWREHVKEAKRQEAEARET